MSAWIVSRAHIDVLVQGLVHHGIAEELSVDEIGAELWRENHRSVNARYGEKKQTPTYSYRPPTATIEPGGLMAAIRCYDYQSCEHEGWEKSRANEWVSKLYRDLEIAGVGTELGKYPWGYDEKDVHAA